MTKNCLSEFLKTENKYFTMLDIGMSVCCAKNRQWIFVNKTKYFTVQVNLGMTDSMGPGKLVRHMQNPLYTYEYLICIGLGPSISSVICKNPLYSGPSYPSSPVLNFSMSV